MLARKMTYYEKRTTKYIIWFGTLLQMKGGSVNSKLQKCKLGWPGAKVVRVHPTVTGSSCVHRATPSSGVFPQKPGAPESRL